MGLGGGFCPKRCLLSKQEKAAAGQEDTFSGLLESSVPSSPRQPARLPLCSRRLTGPPTRSPPPSLPPDSIPGREEGGGGGGGCRGVCLRGGGGGRTAPLRAWGFTVLIAGRDENYDRIQMSFIRREEISSLLSLCNSCSVIDPLVWNLPWTSAETGGQSQRAWPASLWERGLI